MAKLDLSERHLKMVLDLLREHLPEAEAWAHGSRVRGTSHAGSDLDLAVRSPDGSPVDRKGLAKMRRALCESDLPMLVDVFDWPNLSERFRKEVEKDRFPLVPLPVESP